MIVRWILLLIDHLLLIILFPVTLIIMMVSYLIVHHLLHVSSLTLDTFIIKVVIHIGITILFVKWSSHNIHVGWYRIVYWLLAVDIYVQRRDRMAWIFLITIWSLVLLHDLWDLGINPFTIVLLEGSIVIGGINQRILLDCSLFIHVCC